MGIKNIITNKISSVAREISYGFIMGTSIILLIVLPFVLLALMKFGPLYWIMRDLNIPHPPNAIKTVYEDKGVLHINPPSDCKYVVSLTENCLTYLDSSGHLYANTYGLVQDSTGKDVLGVIHRTQLEGRWYSPLHDGILFNLNQK